jgi:uncharacterized SAM-binding protein YcdF (DUF218 family)
MKGNESTSILNRSTPAHDIVAQTRASSPDTKAKPDRLAMGGLLVRRYQWSLTFRAKIILCGLAIIIGIVAMRQIYPFLAITHRVDTNILVVEGWVHKYAIRAAIGEFGTGHYQRVFTTGGPVIGNGGYVNDYQTAASVGADLLKKFGLAADVVQMVPSRGMDRDRTYSSAVALKEWLREHHEQVKSLNILTEGAHGRRTRLMFQKALGPDVKVGVISVPNPDFDVSHWWRYSEGVEEIIDELIGYLYAKLFLSRAGYHS